MIYTIQSISEIGSVAKQFLNENSSSRIFAFNGEMGAGKTTFILELLKVMNVDHPEGSPTYSLINTYESPEFGSVYHFDVYRINSEEEALDIGIEEMLYGDAYCFIEWPEKIANLLPENTVWVKITEELDGTRRLKVEGLKS